MKKYYPVDFDEKGNAVLGTPKNTPTSNGFIPTTWAPGGSDEGKQGLKSISISPAITTTPALDSVNVYWEDLTEEQKASGVRLVLNCPNQLLTQDYAVTLTPTDGWAIYTDDEPVAGEPVTFTLPCNESGGARFVLLSEIPIINTIDEEEGFGVTVSFVDNDPK